MIGVFGDLILDKYIIGEATRISPEAPVPIVKVLGEKYTLGGAANVANNLIKLKSKVHLYGVIGHDAEGKILETICEENNIKYDFYKTTTIPTTFKTRIIARNQQMIRLDRESTFSHIPSSLEFFKKKFIDYKTVVISDYNKGFCSDDLCELIWTNNKDSKIMVDPKGKDWTKYNGAFLVKPNISELENLINTSILNEDTAIANIGKEVFEKYNFKNLIITRGHKGMTLINSKNIVHYPAKSVEVYDVSGAGDTAMAILAWMIDNNYNMDEAIRKAIAASTYVVTKPMTYAINLEELDAI